MTNDIAFCDLRILLNVQVFANNDDDNNQMHPSCSPDAISVVAMLVAVENNAIVNLLYFSEKKLCCGREHYYCSR